MHFNFSIKSGYPVFYWRIKCLDSNFDIITERFKLFLDNYIVCIFAHTTSVITGSITVNNNFTLMIWISVIEFITSFRGCCIFNNKFIKIKNLVFSFMSQNPGHRVNVKITAYVNIQIRLILDISNIFISKIFDNKIFIIISGLTKNKCFIITFLSYNF